MDYKELGQRIKEERLKNNFTQEQLGEKIGVTRLYITFIEKGKRSVKIDILEKIADCLKVSTDYLIKGSGPLKHKEAVHEFEQMINKLSEKELSELMDIVKVIAIRFIK